MKNKSFQITMNERHIKTIMEAAKVIESETGSMVSRSEAIRVLSFRKAKEILKEHKQE